MSDAGRLPRAKDEQDRILSMELEMTFPASDPPASTQPSSGVTGPVSHRAGLSLDGEVAFPAGNNPVDEVFDAFLKLDPEERARFLALINAARGQ